MFAEDELVKSHKERADIIGNIIIISFAIILARLWFLQIYSGKLLYRYSLENRLRKEVVKAPRGMIFSRNNELLVHNAPRFDLIVTPQYLKDEVKSIKMLSKIINISAEKIDDLLEKNAGQASYLPITVKKNISRREVAMIETEGVKLPGISVGTIISREYRDADVGAHVLGYISEISQDQLPKYRKRDKFNYKLGDFIGQAGLEEQLDLDLRGSDGFEFMEVDAHGRMKRYVREDNLFKGIENMAARPGKNIRLTIDRDLQLTAYKALEGKVGGVVALDPTTGEVLAMVSRPAFDPSKFTTGVSSEYWSSLIKDDNNPLRDRNIQEHYPPGSTFKMITAVAALEAGVIDEKTEVNCPGSFRLGRRKFHCWRKNGHGLVDIHKAIRESCDVFFYKVATKLDIDVLAKYAKLLGLGIKTGITLPRETSGLIPTKEWKLKRNGQEWQLGETLSCVIGQSYVLLTPLQLAMAYGVIANGGTLFKPFLIKELFSNTGEVLKKSLPEPISTVKLSPKTLKLVREGLFEVVNSPTGTGWWHKGQGIQMAGKTGTSQVMKMSAEKLFGKCEEYDFKSRNHGLFAAYAPAGDPKIAVGVIVEHGCHGASAAAPVAEAVITKFMEKYYPDLKKENMMKEVKLKQQAAPKALPEESEDAPMPVTEE